MAKFPGDAPKQRRLRAQQTLGFELVQEREHFAMLRRNTDGARTPLTRPNRRAIMSSTLRTILRQSHIQREDFPSAYEKS